jgi:hypothetical protein
VKPRAHLLENVPVRIQGGEFIVLCGKRPLFDIACVDIHKSESLSVLPEFVLDFAA